MTEQEWLTRKKRIDKKLKEMNPPWIIQRFKEGMDSSSFDHHAIEEFPTNNGPADYVLFVKGQILGVIEAKKVGVGPQEVLGQAKRYAKGIQNPLGRWNGFGVPFLYSSNGEIVWFLDARPEKQVSRELSNFHTPDALEDWLSRDGTLNWFQAHSTDEIERLRPYQKLAIEASEKAINEGKRSFLLAMATGTGKTFTTVAQIYRLLESKVARRVLFLVDRRALAAQAVREFAAFNTPKGNKFNQEYEVYSQRFRREDFEDEPFDPKVLPEAYLTTPQSTHTFVYVSTIQRMAINLFGRQTVLSAGGDENDDDDTDKLDIPIHAFDVIIADECHRGYTARQSGLWRQVIDHFDAIKVGLTATPALHTLNLFHEVAYRYTTEEAIQAGWLVDYDAVKIKSDVQINGLFLREGEQVEVVDRETGKKKMDELEDEREFPTAELEEKITAPESNQRIIQEIAKYAEEHKKETGRFPKTLIFAANDQPHVSHADQLVRICRKVFNEGDDFVQKITGTVDRPIQHIKEFRNRPKPRVVVTVDMLTTGIDIPELEFLVFLRPVKSRILWVQMLGRGTRRCTEINKEKFTIFDCFDGTLIEYFKGTTDFEIDIPQKEATSLKEVIENIYLNKDQDYWVKVLVKRLRRIERTMSGDAIQKFSQFILNGDIGQFAAELPKMVKNEFVKTMPLLRNPDFQSLLLDYPKANRPFYRAIEQTDNVTSDFVFHRGDKYEKPKDYLESFCSFVREHQVDIEAIRILMEKPKNWNPSALEDLKNKLIKNQFPLEVLQRAHKLVYQKALVDIISMVKHAVKKEEPLLSDEERVDRALGKVKAGKTFNDEQLKWLSYIREHLVKSLTLAPQDFEENLFLQNRGGLVRAKIVFQNQLGDLINDINFALAA